MQIRTLWTLTYIVTVMVVLDALWQPFIFGTATLFPVAFQERLMPVASSLDSAALGFKIATFVVFSIWIYVAGRNLVAAEYDDLEFTPGSRIWWFAIPIASLFKPFQGMRELWNASHGEEVYQESASLVTTWWALWLLANVVSYVVGMSGENAGITPALWVSCALDIALAVVAITMLHGIARAQSVLTNRDANLAEVFG